MPNEFTTDVIEAVQASPLWAELNKKANRVYEQTGRIPTEKEYQALRTVLICKVMLEDPNVREVLCSSVYEELSAR